MNTYPSGIKEKLEERKTLLMQRISRVKKDVTKEHSADWSEQAQERQNDEVLDVIGNESQNELSQINRALERMNSGVYEICENCGEEIAVKRLEAVPYTDLCIKCAAK